MPPSVALDFTGRPLPLGTLVSVTGPDGAPVSSGDAEIRGRTLVQALAGSRAEGTYRVEWRSTSSDGHALSGTFEFTVTEGGPAPGASSPEGMAPDEPVTDTGIAPVWPAAGAVVLVGVGVAVVTRVRARP